MPVQGPCQWKVRTGGYAHGMEGARAGGYGDKRKEKIAYCKLKESE